MKTKPKLICSHYDAAKCPKMCDHAGPHNPIHEAYEGGIGYCHQVKGVCHYRADTPLCRCGITEIVERAGAM